MRRFYSVREWEENRDGSATAMMNLCAFVSRDLLAKARARLFGDRGNESQKLKVKICERFGNS